MSENVPISGSSNWLVPMANKMWCDGVVVTQDPPAREQLFCTVVKELRIKNKTLWYVIKLMVN